MRYCDIGARASSHLLLLALLSHSLSSYLVSLPLSVWSAWRSGVRASGRGAHASSHLLALLSHSLSLPTHSTRIIAPVCGAHGGAARKRGARERQDRVGSAREWAAGCGWHVWRSLRCVSGPASLANGLRLKRAEGSGVPCRGTAFVLCGHTNIIIGRHSCSAAQTGTRRQAGTYTQSLL